MIDYGTLDVLYFKCLSNSLTGNMKKTKLYFDLIALCSQDPEERMTLQSYLNKDKHNELQRIKRQLDIGKPIEEFEDITLIEENIEPTINDLRLERDVVKLSYYDLDKFNKFLGYGLECKGIEREKHIALFTNGYSKNFAKLKLRLPILLMKSE